MSTFRRLCALGGPFKLSIGIALLLSAATLLSAMALMATSAYLIAKAAIVADIAALAIAFTSVRVFAISRAGFRYLERLTSHVVTFHILARVRTWFYAAVEPLAPARFGGYRSGELLARSVTDIQTIEGFYVRVFLPPAAAVLTCAAVCVFLALFDVQLGLTLLPFLIVAGVLVPIALLRLTAKPAAATVTHRAAVHSALVDEVQGAADLIVFDNTSAHRGRNLVLAAELLQSEQNVAACRGAAGAFVGLLTAIATATLVLIAVPLVTTGTLDGLYLAMVALVTIAVFEAVQPLSQAAERWSASRTAAERVFEVVDTAPAVVDAPDALRRVAMYRIEFRDASFCYEADTQHVLDHLDLTVEEGECVAIAGPSGSGKSTLVNLLLRFWEPTCGQVLLGATDLRDYDLEAVRDCIAVVPQEIHLFNTTIRDNLLLANPEANDAQLLDACRVALLDDFVASLPEGLETPVGENGLTLSGGERQRLAIARAVLKDAPIVVLDEPTANLDPVTEARIMDSLDAYLTGHTVLLISHREAVLAHADRVLNLQYGRIEAHGSSEAGIYAPFAGKGLALGQNDEALTSPKGVGRAGHRFNGDAAAVESRDRVTGE